MIIEVLIPYVYDRAFIYQAAATLTTYYAIKIAHFIRQRRRRHRLCSYYGIPTPEPSLLDGNLRTLSKGRQNFLIHEEWKKKFGKIYGYYIGDQPSLIVTDLEMIKKIFLEEQHAFTERTQITFGSVLSYSILFARYPRWKFMRKVMSPSFKSYSRGESSVEFIETSVGLMIDYIDQRLKEAESGNERANIDIHDLMKSTALHLISALAIDLQDVRVKENEENVKSLDEFLSVGGKSIAVIAIMFPLAKYFIKILYNHFEYGRILGKIHRKVNATIDEELTKLKSNDLDPIRPNEKQLIKTLIKLHHEGKMSRTEIMGNVEALLFAGYDTTSTTLTYIFWALAKHPEIQKKLRVELMAHGTESKYLEQVIKETMRLYPTVMSFTTRLATSTIKIDDFTIPQGAHVKYHAWLMYRDPKIWPEPEVFDPERFKEGIEIHPAAYAPFGLGERKCLGIQLALLEMKVIICDILLRYKLVLKSPESLELVSYANSLSKPKDKIMIELQKLE